MPLLPGQTLSTISRTYNVYVPDNPVQATVPAIFVFHGGGQDAQTIARRWGIDTANPANPPPPPLDGYLLVFPEADPRLSDEWVHFQKKDSAFPTYDLLFVDQLLAEILATTYTTSNPSVPDVTVDPALVYTAGFSNGAALCWQLMNSNLVSRFKGFAAVGKANRVTEPSAHDQLRRAIPRPTGVRMELVATPEHVLQRRMLLGGIYMMAATVLALVVWPSVEAIVSTVFVGLCVLAGLVLAVVIGR